MAFSWSLWHNCPVSLRICQAPISGCHRGHWLEHPDHFGSARKGWPVQWEQASHKHSLDWNPRCDNGCGPLVRSEESGIRVWCFSGPRLSLWPEARALRVKHYVVNTPSYVSPMVHDMETDHWRWHDWCLFLNWTARFVFVGFFSKNIPRFTCKESRFCASSPASVHNHVSTKV